uniref:NADH:ubiquinone reductase (H(+)-translocating) n=1 Tax=Parascaris equorum TaxID=6256 RepID=A0A914RWL8_PAREQ
MYVQFGIYIVEGSILFIVSVLILIALIRTPKMAERYSLIVAQYCTNALMGFGTVLGGAARLGMMFSDCLQLRSARFCMLMPWNILFIW